MEMELNLWYTRPEDLPAQTTAKDCEHVLSEAELQRSKSYRLAKHRIEYFATRLLVRNALSHYHPLPPRAWNFQANRYGKPSIDPACNLRFNLSNTQDLVVCLISEGIELGIDIEPLGRAAEVAKVAADVFSPRELSQLETLSGPQKLDRALSLWTLKESYIKARGLGLSLPLKSFSFVFEESNEFHIEMESRLNDNPANWQFCFFDLEGHRVALTVENKIDPLLRIWEARPPMNAPLQRPDALPSQPIFSRNLQ